VDANLLLVAAAIAGVLAIALFMRRGAGDERVELPGAGEGREEGGRAPEDEEEAEDDRDDTPLVVESDGHVWLPSLSGLRRLYLGGEEADPMLTAAGYVSRDEFERRRTHARVRGDATGLTGEPFHPGDFSAARVVRGAAGLDPWRLEALGPDGEYMTFGFDSEEAARTALGLLEQRGVVRRPLDDDGQPIPPSPGDFEEARRRAEQTERELELDDERHGEEPR
jgi:hypothetical protein